MYAGLEARVGATVQRLEAQASCRSTSTSDNPVAFAERSDNLLSLGLLQRIAPASRAGPTAYRQEFEEIPNHRTLAASAKRQVRHLRGRRSPTRCRSWGSLAHCSDGRMASAPNLGLLISRLEHRCPI